MQYIYLGAIFAAATIFLLIGLLLFLQRKRGERSRMLLAGMSFLSLINYIGIIVYFFIDPTYASETILDVPFLLLGIFVMIIYFIYPIEVISPGWITGKRLLKMYLPVIGLYLLYGVTLWLGVEYTAYKTLAELVQDIGSFQVIFRMVLFLLIFLPALLLYYVPYTRQYNNTNYKWMRGYIVAMMINMMAYLFVNVVDTFLTCSLYVAISISCSLYFTYQELYVRLIRQPIGWPSHSELEIKLQPVVQIKSVSKPKSNPQQVPNSKESDLFEQLEHYMNSTQGWQDPDLSVRKVTSDLYTNRVSLLKVIKLHGHNGFPAYVNDKRIAEFIQIVEQQRGENYSQTFFDVGFRSKATALRNFREFTGVTPSEYFQKHTRQK